MLNILQVVPAFYPATYWGGPVYSVFGLCNALAELPDVALRVLTTDSAGPTRSASVNVVAFPTRFPAGYEVFFCRRNWAASVSLGMLSRLWPMIRWADVVHLTAVYSAPTIPTLLICRILGKPVVWSPRGALQRWEGTTRPLTKRAWEQVCDVLLSRQRCVLHVTSPQEQADSKARITNADAALIPNAVEIPLTLPPRNWLPNGKQRLLYLGRLHPIKGIENLLHALKNLEDDVTRLEICGSGDESYSASLRRLVRELGLEGRVSFRGHVDGEEKMKAFMNADVCVVPSFTENFGMVVAEALAHGVPVIAGKGTPWVELEQRGSGLWVDNSPASLAQAITRMRTERLAEAGARGRAWMQEEYSWSRRAAAMLVLYNRLLSRA